MVLCVLALSSVVYAQDAQITLTPPGNIRTIDDVITKITTFLYMVASPLIVIMILIGGFQMLTAQDNVSKFEKGRKTIMYAAIGTVVILVASGIGLVVKSFLIE